MIGSPIDGSFVVVERTAEFAFEIDGNSAAETLFECRCSSKTADFVVVEEFAVVGDAIIIAGKREGAAIPGG